jgi:Sulfotransferase family
VNRYVFLLGRGRSGTTWIGRILNHYYRCIYKYEPFNKGKSLLYSQWLQNLSEDSTPQQLKQNFDSLVSTCEHQVDYPPFMIKSCRKQNPFILRLCWQLGKAIPKLQWLYNKYGEPLFTSDDSVLIKQVNFPNEHLKTLTKVLEPTIICLIRGPYSSISSAIQFYKKTNQQIKTPESSQRVRCLIEREDHDQYKQYAEIISDLSPSAFEALRWRIQTEPLIEFSNQYPNSLNIKFEDILNDPEKEFSTIFNFLNWPFDEKIKNAIKSTGKKNIIDELFKNELFNVHKSKNEVANKWKTNLSQTEKNEINEIIKDSPINHFWSD